LADEFRRIIRIEAWRAQFGIRPNSVYPCLSIELRRDEWML